MGVLGCAGEYTAAIHRRGGATPALLLRGLTGLRWSRRLDDASTAEVVVYKPAAGADCCSRLAEVFAWGHELSLYRDGELVWQGPIVSMSETRDRVTVDARDVTAWLDRRVNRVGFDYTGGSAVGWVRMAEDFIRAGFAADDPGVLPYLQVLGGVGGVGERQAPADSTYWGEELREIARIGVDYTTVGRSILLAEDLTAHLGRLVLREDHFGDEVEVILSGGLLATRQIAAGQDGVFAASAGGVDDFYGLLDTLTVVDGATSTATTQHVADMALAGSYPQPVVVRVPDGATLTPDAPAAVSDLVAGVRVDVAVPSYCRQVAASMRLARLDVEWTVEAGERVQVALSPVDAQEVAGA